MKEIKNKVGGKYGTHSPFPPEARVARAPTYVLHFYYQVVQWEETGSAVFISDLSPITGAISQQSLLANGNTRGRRLTRPLATTSLLNVGKKNVARDGETDSARPTACSISGEALSPRLPRQNPSRPPRADRIPRFVFMKRLLRDIFPERRNILAKSQVLQSHEAIMSFGCKIAPCGRFGAQECHFLEKKKMFPPRFSHESTDTSFKSP